MAKVYITDHTFLSTEPEQEILAPYAEVVDLKGIPLLDEETVISACPEADALVVGFIPITARIIDALAGLRCIVRYGVGWDMIDVAAATERGVWVANVPDYCVAEVADHTTALLLCLTRKIAIYDSAVRKGAWGAVKIGHPIRRLAGRTLGLVGFGRIGREVAARAKSFGFRVVVYDKYLEQSRAEACGVEPVTFERLLSEADAVSLHAPLTDETRRIIDGAAIARMKKDAVLVNAARGGLVDIEALADALSSGRLAGAAIDVFDTEPLPSNHPIRKAPNALLQPHASWYSEESLRQLQRSAAEEGARVLRGERPKNPVNEPKGI